MNQDFVNYIKENIVGFLPDNLRDAEISVVEVIKGNDRKLTSLIIGDPLKGVPHIYLDEYEEQYVNGRGMNEILQEIAKQRQLLEMLLQVQTYDPATFVDYEAVKPKLAIRMCNYDQNKEFLKDKPYTKVANLAATYRINAVEDYFDEIANTQSAIINDDLLRIWQITKEELHRDALEVELKKRGVLLFDATDSLEINPTKIENLFYRQEPLPRKNLELYILTNEFFTNGAGLVMQDGVLERVGELLGRDFYVLPSSIHEVVIRPVDGRLTQRELDSTIQFANLITCDPKEVISDQALYYDRKQKTLRRI